MNFLGVYGHVNVDFVMKIKRFPEPNTSIEIVKQERYFGGTGGNIARIASELGVKVALASFVGEDFSEDYRNELKRSGIDLQDLIKVKNYPTPTCWLFSWAQNQIGVMNQGPMRESTKFKLLKHALESSKLIHLGTGRPDYYKKVATYAKKLGKELAFEPAQELHYLYTPKKFEALLKKADYFFASQKDCETALRYLDLKKPEELLEFVKVFVLTKGSKGSEIFTSKEKIKIPCVKAKRVIDTTGAGDAYKAGFYAGLSKKYSLKKCGLLASTVASFIVEAKGAQTNIPTWKQVLSRASAYL